MAVTIDHRTKIISILQSDLTLISGTLYELDTNQFKKDVAALLDDEAGMVSEDAFTHNTEVTLAGVTFARTIEFINGYTVTFEDLQYRVRLVGSNNNVSDVANVNQVSILSQNSAGLIVTDSGAGDWSAAEKEQIRDALGVGGTKTAAAGGQLQQLVSDFFQKAIDGGLDFEQVIYLIAAVLLGKSNGFPTQPTFRSLADDKDAVNATMDGQGNRSTVTYDA